MIQSCNASAERMFGYTADELVGRPVRMLIPAERQAEEDDILARLRRGESVEHFETVRLTKDGRRLDVSLTVSPVRDDRGTIIGASKIVRDVTALKQNEAERLRLLQENAAVTETLNSVGAIVASDLDRDTSRAGGDRRRHGADDRRIRRVLLQRGERERRVVHALHDLRRAAGGVLAIPDAAKHRGVRADLQRHGHRPERRHHEGSALRPQRAASRHAQGSPAGAKLPGRAGARAGRARSSADCSSAIQTSGASPSSTSGWRWASHRGPRSRSRMRACTRACRRPAGSRTISSPACRTSCGRR